MKRMLVIMLLASATPALAQTSEKAAPVANPMVSSTAFVYGMAKGNVVKSAEQMSEENYAFKPTPDVRSFGQLLGHVANAEFMFCSLAAGVENPNKDDFEKTRTTKAALIEALKASSAYCDKVHGSLSDTKAAEPVKFFGMSTTRAGALVLNAAHTMEHYGNIVTYFRLKGMVPPSSQRGM